MDRLEKVCNEESRVNLILNKDFGLYVKNYG